MNLGTFDYLAHSYTKYVKFSAAVLWKDRQLSLPLPVMSRIEKYEIDKIIFVDNGKNERWIFDTEKVKEKGERKIVGQEPQWYFPIELARKIPSQEKFMYK